MAAIIAALLKKKAAGTILGLLASKTQYGASAGALGGLWAVLPRAFEKDPEAIGQVCLIIFGWAVALYGRLKAKPDAPKKKGKS